MAGSKSILAEYELEPGFTGAMFFGIDWGASAVALATIDPPTAMADAPSVALATADPPLGTADGLPVALATELRAHGALFEEIDDDDASRHWWWVRVLLDIWERARRANPELTEVEFGSELGAERRRRQHRRMRAPGAPGCLRREPTAAPDDEGRVAYSGSWVSKKLVTARKWARRPQTEAECWQFMRDFHGHSTRKSVADQTPEERRREVLRAVERDARKACELGCSREEVQSSVEAGIRSAGDLPSAATNAARLGATGENAC